MLKNTENEKKLSSVMEKTEKLMEEESATRNSDKVLIVRYLSKYHKVKNINDILYRKDIPSFESIRRSRQRIQADNRCLPEENVAELREENQVTFLDFFKNRRNKKKSH